MLSLISLFCVVILLMMSLDDKPDYSEVPILILYFPFFPMFSNESTLDFA